MRYSDAGDYATASAKASIDSGFLNSGISGKSLRCLFKPARVLPEIAMMRGALAREFN